jgi:hypothetical protein
LNTEATPRNLLASGVRIITEFDDTFFTRRSTAWYSEITPYRNPLNIKRIQKKASEIPTLSG